MRKWTPEERRQQAFLIQQWRPWLKATGPRTQDGKVISSRNAYKHGLSRWRRLAKGLLR